MGTQAESVISMYLSGLKKDYGGKRCVFNEERNRARLGRIEVGGEENSKWMGRQIKKSVDHFPTKYQGLLGGICQGILNFLLGYRG